MTLKELRAKLERRWPDAWHATKTKGGYFILRRIDSIELIAIEDLVTLAKAFPKFDAFISKEPRWPNGVDHGVWLMPKSPKPRKKSAKR